MRRSLVGLASALVVWNVAGPAAADDNMVPTTTTPNYCTQGAPNNGAVCQTQDAIWTWWYQPSTISPTDFNVAAQVMGGEYNPTDLVVDHVATVATTPDRTDMLFQRGVLDAQFAGYAWCQHPIANSWKCDQHYVRIQNGQFMSYGLLCHEFGHAVGLTHGPNAFPVLSDSAPQLGCMRRPLIEVSSLTTLTRNEINDVY